MCDGQNSFCVARSWVSPSRVASLHTAPATFLICRRLVGVVIVVVVVVVVVVAVVVVVVVVVVDSK